jgi:hypothetical protein
MVADDRPAHLRTDREMRVPPAHESSLPMPRQYAPDVAHYIFNFASREEAAAALESGTWDLAAGDLVLLYLAAPERTFVGRAELAAAPSSGGVSLAEVEEWQPPVSMHEVLSRIDTSGGARADFDTSVVRITAGEYETALAVAAAR